MTKEQIYSTLKTLIIPYLPEDVAPESITETSDLTKELNINSSHLVDIVLDVEDTFEIAITNSDMEQLQTVADAIHIIHSKKE